MTHMPIIPFTYCDDPLPIVITLYPKSWLQDKFEKKYKAQELLGKVFVTKINEMADYRSMN